MPKVNMLEAKTNLSKLVEAVETGKETEIILARNGRPVARIVPLEVANRVIGVADGEVDFDLNEFQALDEVVWKDVLDARWERFERHSRELDEKYGRKRNKSV